MIIELLFNMIFGLLNIILGLLPKLPDLGENMLDDFHSALITIFDNSGLLGFFFPIATIKILIPLVILVVNFDKIYHLAMWVLTWIKSHN